MALVQEELASAEALPAPGAFDLSVTGDSDSRLQDARSAAAAEQESMPAAEAPADRHAAMSMVPKTSDQPSVAAQQEGRQWAQQRLAALEADQRDLMHQVIKLEREKAATEADRVALGQRLEQEWEAREAADAAARDAAHAAARAAAQERDALQDALEKEREQSISREAARKQSAAEAAAMATELAELKQQVASLEKENKKVSAHLKAAQSARAAAQRAASQLKQENAALAEARDTGASAPTSTSMSADHAECQTQLAAALREASRLQAELTAARDINRGLAAGLKDADDALSRAQHQAAEVVRLKAEIATAQAERQRLTTALTAAESARDAFSKRAEELAQRLDATEEEVMVLGQSLREVEARHRQTPSPVQLEHLALVEAQRASETDSRQRAEEVAAAAERRAAEETARRERAEQQAAAAQGAAAEASRSRHLIEEKLIAAEDAVRKERAARKDAERKAAAAEAGIAERRRSRDLEGKHAFEADAMSQQPATDEAQKAKQAPATTPSELAKLVSYPVKQSPTESSGSGPAPDAAQQAAGKLPAAGGRVMQGVSKATRVFARLSLSRRSPQPITAAVDQVSKISEQPAAIAIRAAGADLSLPKAAVGLAADSAKGAATEADAAQASAGGSLLKAVRPRQAGRAAVMGAVGNPQMIKNALTRLCLPGPGKENERAAVLALIDADRGASRFMILIRGSGSFAYRGFYAVNSDKETLVKVHGRGPEAIEQAAVLAFFRYDSSARELRSLSRGPSFGAAHAVVIAPPSRPSSAN